MKVLFSSTAGHGHVFPLVPLAQALMGAGHEVLWAGADAVVALAEQAGIAATPAGLNGLALESALDGLRSRSAEIAPVDRAAFMFPTMFGETLTPPMVEGLLAVARDWHPDLLVHEQSELASPLVGALIGRPSVTQSFGGAVPEPFLAEASRRVAPLWTAHGREIPDYAGCFSSLYLDICPERLQPVSIAHIASRQGMRPVSYTGPAQPFTGGGEQPLVYLTLGTVPGNHATLAAAVAAIAELPVRLLVTVGPAGDPAVLGDQPEHVRVERFVSQTDVLPHCAVVVSHAGSGTFLGALSLGLPQLCLPQAADQFRNAAVVGQVGAGLVLPPDRATPEAVRDAVRRLLEDGAFRVAAQSVADDIGAMPAPTDVVPLLEALGTG